MSKNDSVRMPKMAGQELKMAPPFYFQGMTTSVFPLRADQEALQMLCDQYLNLVPKSVGHFRATMPYVYFMAIDYGRMAQPAANMGWVSQREFGFCVMVEHYKEIDGELRFHDMACFFPYIFVDDVTSMGIGRLVYGWPKAYADVNPAYTGWLSHPTGHTLALALKTDVFSSSYNRGNLETKTFLEIRSQKYHPTRFPLNPDSPMMPWNIMRNLGEATTGLTTDFISYMAALAQNESGFPSVWTGMQGSISNLAAQIRGGKGIGANTLNLKQFRRSDEQTEYCFQALTAGAMRMKGFNDAGLFGQALVASGDLSAGYCLNLSRYPSLPIIETLGLQVDGHSQYDDVEVAHIKPFLPFWYNVDMEYDRAQNLALRYENGNWLDSNYEPIEPDNDEPESQEDDPAVQDPELEYLYNTCLGTDIRVITGPLLYRNTTIRILPLLAKRKTLEDYIYRHLNSALDPDPAKGRFKLWAPDIKSEKADGVAPESQGKYAYVHLVIANNGNISSITNDIGSWENKAVDFYIPIIDTRSNFKEKAAKKKTRKGAKPDEAPPLNPNVGVFPAFSAARTGTQAFTATELLGIPTLAAKITVPTGDWLPFSTVEDGSGEPRTLASLQTKVIPVNYEGQGMESRTIVEVLTSPNPNKSNSNQEPPPTPPPPPNQVQLTAPIASIVARKPADTFSEALKNALEANRISDMTNLDLESSMQGSHNDEASARLNIFTLKQFRDCHDVKRACYQALIQVPISIYQVKAIGSLDEDRHGLFQVKVMNFGDFPIVEELGLVATSMIPGDGAMTYVLEPVKPFEYRIDMRRGYGERLAKYNLGTGWEELDPDNPS